uniref:Nucleotide-diphospho-sugar transferase domain-containing protein n=1 Tax=Heterosigma akashiwo TaxID=2829 RepID=A0A7S3Y8X6_HETAK
MAQARQWNRNVYFVEEGSSSCKEWMETHDINHIHLDSAEVQELFLDLHDRFPELKDMNAEFTYAYARQWHYLDVARLLGVSEFVSIDGDVMTYIPASHLAKYMRENGYGAAFCLYWPRANNLMGYFTTAALNEMISYLDAFPRGKSPWPAGDMGWLKNYAALPFRDEEVGFSVRRPANFTPKFKVGNTCSYWNGGIGADVIRLDQDWEGHFKTHVRGFKNTTFKTITWRNHMPHFTRSNDSRLVPIWHTHFKGTNKAMMQNYLRWYGHPHECLVGHGHTCSCSSNHCIECYSVSPCDFSPPAVVDQQKLRRLQSV